MSTPTLAEMNQAMLAGIQQHTDTAAYLREQGDSIAAAKQDMLDNVEAATEAAEAEVDNFKSVAAASIAATMDARGGLVPFMTTSGQVDWYFGIPKFQIEDLRPDGTLGTGTHPAFVLENGQEAGMLWYSAYALSLSAGEVVSQPNKQPYTGRTQAEEIALCAASSIAGVGPKRVSSIWDESALALIVESLVAGGMTEPVGNTAYGSSYSSPTVRGHGRTWSKTGTIGHAANHNRNAFGVSDFVGNVWTRSSGMYLQDGEIFLAENNDPASIGNPISTGYFYSSSSASSSGFPSIVNSAAAVIRNGTIGNNSNSGFSDTSSGASGFASLTGPSSALLRLAGLAPHKDGSDLSGAFLSRSYGLRAPLMRGGWFSGPIAGPRALALNYEPAGRGSDIGFRSAFLSDIS